MSSPNCDVFPDQPFQDSDIVDIYPLTPMQEGFLYESLLEPHAWLEQFHVELSPQLDQDAFVRAWRLVFDHHAVLRTSFAHLGLERPLQLVHQPLRLPLTLLDGNDLAAFLAEDRARPFNLTRPPLMRLTLLRGEKIWFIWTFHHIILDGWSLSLLFSQLAQTYAALTAGHAPTLQDVRPFRQFIAHLEARDAEGDRTWWRQRLQDFTRATPPPGACLYPKPGPPRRRTHQHSLNPERTQAIHAFCRRHHLTPAALCASAWALLLTKMAAAKDVVIGVTVAGRPAALQGAAQMIGPFLNTLPARFTPKGPLTAWLQQAAADLAADEDHAWRSPAQIAADSAVPAGEPLFHALFVYENLNFEHDYGPLDPRNPQLIESVQSPLGLQILPRPQTLDLTLHVDTTLVPPAVAEALLPYLDRILSQCLKLVPIQHMRLTDETQRARLLAQMHQGVAPQAPPQPLHQRLEQWAHERGDAVALQTHTGAVLTYAELNHRANHLAHHLLALNLPSEQPVGLLTPHHDPAVIACLACFKAGAVYTPFDVDLPPARMQDMAATAGLGALITDQAEHAFAKTFSGPILNPMDPHHHQAANPNPALEPERAAYLIFTSGSTGQPKGAVCTHAGLARMTQANQRLFQITPNDRCALFHALNFDASILEMWSPLLAGAQLIPVPRDLRADHPALAQWLVHQRISVLVQPPANLLELIAVAPEPPPHLRLLICGGSPLHSGAVRAWLQSPRLRLLNCYGLTEATVCNTAYHVRPQDDGPCPIGQTTVDPVYLLDDQLEPVPVGVPGHLYLGGSSLARGYHGRPNLTAARFIPVPSVAAQQPGDRLYQTGDRACLLPDGKLHFLGRDDQQVKIRGHRLELAEIKAAMSRFEGLRDHTVQLYQAAGKAPMLAAWIIPAQAHTDDLIPNLRRHLAQHLSPAMIPSVFTCIDHLPLNTSGKVDHAALPAPVLTTPKPGAPVSPDLALMTRLWAEVLQLDHVNPHDGFFHLGGHSLLATRLVARVADVFDHPLSPRDLFLTGTPAALLDHLTRPAAPPIPAPQPLERVNAPLSHAQQRLWTLDQLNPKSAAYNVPVALWLHGPLNAAALKAAWRTLLERHPVLRQTFQTTPDGPVSVTKPAQPMRLETPAGEDPQARRERALQAARADARTPFNLELGPLYRARLFAVTPNEHLLLLNLHHAVTDAHTMDLLARELEARYRDNSHTQPPKLHYSDVAAWCRTTHHAALYAQQLEWWRRELGDATPRLDLPDEGPLARADEAQYHRFHLDAELTRDLLHLAKTLELTPFMLMESIFVVLLARIGENRDIRVGVPAANRDRPELAEMVGFFANVLVLRHVLTQSGDPEMDAFSTLAHQTRRIAVNAYAHRDLPFDHLVTALAPNRNPSQNPLFRVMFSLNDHAAHVPRFKDLHVSVEPLHTFVAKDDLSLDLTLVNGIFQGEMEAAGFHPKTLATLARTFVRLCRHIVTDPDQSWPRIPLQDVAQLSRQPFKLPQGPPIHDAFFAAAQRVPDQTALELMDANGFQSISYKDAARRVQHLAAHLQAQGVGPETIVAVTTRADAYLSILAILTAGGVYLPLDCTLPQDRRRRLLQDSGAALLLTTAPKTDAIRTLNPRQLSQQPAPHPLQTNDSRPIHGACLIYTSGSSGQPKGVLVHHGALCNHLTAISARFRLTTTDRVLQFASLSFDVAAEELFPTLAAGATLVRLAQTPPPEDLSAEIETHGLTVVNLPASYWRQWTAAPGFEKPLPSTLRLIIAGSETVHAAALNRQFQHHPQKPLWCNAYGVSEACITATLNQGVDTTPVQDPVPIGTPIDNVTAWVLDPHMAPLPDGVPGELFLGGACPARGYHGLPHLTAASFVPDPFSSHPGARLYRTGDRVKRRWDGNLVYLGRRDGQIKCRGYRIEAGEVEAVLQRHPYVGEAVVFPVGEKAEVARLAARVVLVDHAKTHDPSQLQRELVSFCRATLPDWMTPDVFAFSDHLPKTPGGKINRNALTLQDGIAMETPAQRSHADDLVATVWADILGLETVNEDTHFFLAGGHSLAAIRVVNRLKQLMGAELTPRDLFDHPILSHFRERVLQGRAGSHAPQVISAAPPMADYPLSRGQQRLWFLTQMAGRGMGYHMPEVVRLKGDFNLNALQTALHQLMTRHDMLRVVFFQGPDGPRQRLLEQPSPPLQILPAPNHPADLDALIQAEITRPFDLTRAPAFRLAVVRLTATEHLLIHTCHHIISDAWSYDLISAELAHLYSTALHGQTPPEPAARLRYVDFAVWEPTVAIEADLWWWAENLADAPAAVPLPYDRPAPRERTHRGKVIDFQLDPQTTRGLITLGRRAGVTPFMILDALLVTLLHRYGGDDVVIGAAVTNRDHHSLHQVVGFFVNTLALRHPVRDNPRFSDLLQRVRRIVLEAGDHAAAPFDAVVERVAPHGSRVASPLFNVLLALNHTDPTPQFGDLDASPIPVHTGTSKWDLYLAWNHSGDHLDGLLEYDIDRFDAATLHRLIGHLQNLIQGVLSEGQARLSQLPLLTPNERRQILTWNPGDQRHPITSSPLHKFLERAGQSPEAKALSHFSADGPQTLTYGQLARRTQILAAHLAQRGVGRGDRVVLHLDRSADMIAAILAVLYRGATYVPVDPDQPARLEPILSDAKPVLIISNQNPEATRPVLNPAQCDPQITPIAPVQSAPDDPAYIIYTSGSTGRPKGVPVSNAAVTRLFEATTAWYDFGPADVWTLFHSIAFDFSVWELWGALRYGGRLVVVPPQITRDPQAFLDLLADEGVTILNQTPSAFVQLMNQAVARKPAPTLALRRVIFGGEALDPRKLKPWFQTFGQAAPQLINMYGITETTVFVTRRPLTQADAEDPHGALDSIGVAMNDQALFILDRHLQLVPIGVTGEIYIGGAGLSPGYLNQGAQTATRFIPRPAALWSGDPVPGARLYRSGDLGAYLPNGEVAYRGRMDHQVQLRGYRVEPGEIEAALLTLPDVAQALVTVLDAGSDGARLAAYLVPAQPDHTLDTEACRGALHTLLPAYMIPSAWVQLAKLPLTANGKVNHSALPHPHLIVDVDAYIPPQTPTQERLALIWGEVLKQERIGMHTNFFQMGGNSLTAAGVMSRTREAVGYQIPLQILFESPTIAQLGRRIDDILAAQAAMNAVEDADDDEEWIL